MARRLKTTPFARFLLVMIILAPLAYIGASYYNGEDGIQNFKNLIGLGEKTETTITPDKTGQGDAVLKLEDEVKYLKRRVEDLEKENRQLEEKLEEKETELRALRQNSN